MGKSDDIKDDIQIDKTINEYQPLIEKHIDILDK